MCRGTKGKLLPYSVSHHFISLITLYAFTSTIDDRYNSWSIKLDLCRELSKPVWGHDGRDLDNSAAKHVPSTFLDIILVFGQKPGNGAAGSA